MKNNGLAFLIFWSLCLLGCGSESGKSEAQGGVDGSGGDLKTISTSQFQSWISNDLKFYLRDSVHRLYKMRENNTKMPELASRFLDIPQLEFQNQIANLSFVIAEKNCAPTADHNNGSDASIYEDTICFSYEAFKKMPYDTMVSKILILAMHELAHMRGLDETEAVKWQNYFELSIVLDIAIRWGDPQTMSFEDSMSKIEDHLGSALLSAEAGDLNVSCKYLYLAEENAEQVRNYFAIVPEYISQKFLLETVLLSRQCSSMHSTQELFSKILAIADSIILFKQQFANFLSPLCARNFCRTGGPLNSITKKMHLKIAHPELVREWSDADLLKKISCSIVDVKNGAMVNLVQQSEFLNVDDASYPDLKGVSILAIPSNIYSDVKILGATNLVGPTQNKNLSSILEEDFLLNDQDTLKIEFASYDQAIFNNNPVAYPMRKLPKLMNSFELKCTIN